MIEEYKPGELPVFKQGQKLSYPQQDMRKFSAIIDYKICLTEDELDFVDNGVMEIANKIDIPVCFNCVVFSHLYNAVELEEAALIDY